MIFDNKSPFMFKILSVHELSWNESRRYTDGRGFHALSFRIKGSAQFKNGDNVWNAGSDSISFVPKDFPYYHSHNYEHLYVVHFKTDKEMENEEIFTYVPQTPQLYNTLFKKMYDIWNNKAHGYYYAATSVFYTILENMQNDLINASLKKTDKMTRVMEYLHTNFTDSMISVARLSEIFGTSETYFRKTFKEVYKTTPLKYINSLRTDYALELLRSGYFSVSQVAEKSGFGDAKYLSRVIKSKTKKSPSQFK
ncbi:MAG: helix-turn-helix transcriptional regulator [Clostridia bacterium]|nr:helix-turn-helix transcriptional regulator [Clostridia bacterium]